LAQEAVVHERAVIRLGGEAADTLIGGGGRHAGHQQRQARIQEAAAEGNHHGLHAAIGDEEAGQPTADRRDDDGQEHGGPDVQAQIAPQVALDDAGQADDGGGLDINAAGDHHQRNEQRDDTDADVVDDAVHDG